jgi:HEAT repeat protein
MEPGNCSYDLKNEDPWVRASCIIALGKTGDRNAIKHLIGILENKNEVEWLRGCAAIALGRISDKEVMLPLINALQDGSLIVSRAAILGLGDLKDKQSIPHLEGILQDQIKKELHPLTVNVLSTVGGGEVASTLIQALESPDVRV